MKSLFLTTALLLISTANAYAGGQALMKRVMELEELVQDIAPDSVQVRYTASSDIHDIIKHAANQYRIDPLLIVAIIREESAFNTFAVSPKGAQGLMQLMPQTANELGVWKPFDPRQNVMGGTAYFRMLHDRYRNTHKALLAYNCGPVRVDSGRVPGESIGYANRVIFRYKTMKKRRVTL